MTESRVRLGVIGTTWYAETHLRNIQSHPGAELVAITDGTAQRRPKSPGATTSRWSTPTTGT